MAQIKIYADEDAMDQDLVAALRSRGVMVVTATEAFMVEMKDDEHLALAAELGSALYSFNSCDYQRIHGEWMADGRDHFGLIMGSKRSSPLASKCVESCRFARPLAPRT